MPKRPVQHPVGPSRLATKARNLLEQVMQEQNMSAKRLEKLSGVDNTSIGRILRQETIPTLDMLDRIFAGLGYETHIEIIDNADFAHQADLRGMQK